MGHICDPAIAGTDEDDGVIAIFTKNADRGATPRTVSLGQCHTEPPDRALEINVGHNCKAKADREHGKALRIDERASRSSVLVEQKAVDQTVDRLMVHIECIGNQADLRQEGITPDLVKQAVLAGEDAHNDDRPHDRDDAVTE